MNSWDRSIMILGRLSHRQIIVGAILMLTLLLLLFIGHSGWRTWQVQLLAQQHLLESRLSTLTVQLAASRAMERALTMAQLSTGQRTDRDLQRELLQARHTGDQVREKMIVAVQEWLRRKPHDFALEVLLADESKHHQALMQARERMDQPSDQGSPQTEPTEWFDAITHAIEHSEHLHTTAMSFTAADADAGRNLRAVSAWATQAGERAGQERGLLTYYIGARQPIPLQVRHRLQSAAHEVEYYLELLRQAAPRLEETVELSRAILDLDQALPPELIQMRKAVLAAAASGDYPVDRETWLAAANRAVAGLTAVATAGSSGIEAAATAQQQAATRAVVWLLVLGILAMGLAGLAFYRVRDTALSLETQKSLAERAAGKLSEEIATRRKLEQHLRHYQTIVSTSPDHIALIGPDYTYRIVNETYLRAHGTIRGQIVGRRVAELLGEEIFQKLVRQHLDRCLADETVNYESWFDFPSGGRRCMNVTYFPIHDEAGAVAGVVVSSRDVTELKNTEEALRQREEQLRTITDAMPGLVMRLDSDYHYRFINQTGAAWFGSPAASLLGSHMREVVGEEVFAAIRPYYEEAFAGNRTTFERELPCADGVTRWIQLTLVPEVDPGGEGKTVYVLGSDITYRKSIEDALRVSQEGFRSIVEQNLTGIAVLDAAGDTLFCNPAARTMLNESPKSAQYGFSSLDVLRKGNTELDIRRSDGAYGVAQALVSETEWQGASAHLLMLYDITERKAAEREIEHMAYHDSLTGLANRMMLHDRIGHALTRVRRSDAQVALLCINLDRFKIINDSLGHAGGDELLRQIAQRLRKSVREEDTVARLSGDEFMVLLEDLQHPEQVQLVAEKIRLVVGSPYRISNQDLVITSSIGISYFPTDGEDTETLIRHADTATYHAKQSGRNRVQLYQAEMGERFTERVRLERELHQALERKEFRLHYQPQVDAFSGEITGAEALLRWQHPERGLIPPAEFLPVLEESGLIAPVGEWVLHEACQQARAWRTSGLPPLVMAVNLSGRQFDHGNLAGYVAQLLETTGLEPHYLELEITETILMENRTDAPATLRALKQLGVKVAVDDFGTGYSSLSYLKQFEVDRLKIDRSFVRDVPQDVNDVAIVRAILSMARALRLEVTAEGVESQAQLAFLQKYRCNALQGYLFSPPVDAEQFVLLHQSRQESRSWAIS
jgi:diguanylate cyclase (GGDEF)-like protein/PAS domain S-box-containing protein